MGFQRITTYDDFKETYRKTEPDFFIQKEGVSTHGNIEKLKGAYTRSVHFFTGLKAAAPQLTSTQCWYRILDKAMEAFRVNPGTDHQIGPPLPG